MQLFYSDQIEKSTRNFTFSREESKHIIRVLRKKEDDLIYITDGHGHLYTGTISIANPNKCTILIESVVHTPAPSYELHMGVAPTKLNDRYEWFLEKATEIGITTITPILCEHSERKKINEDRYQRIIQSAAKQSLSVYLPELKPLTPLREWLTTITATEGQKFIAHCEGTQKTSLFQKAEAKTPIFLLIGPEGDFSTNEINHCIEQGFEPVSLGSRRLRTETAAVVGCHSIALINEKL